MSREVGAYDAKTHLPQLLRDVEQGDHITITVRGKPIAELVPARRAAGRAGEAVRAMQQFELVKGVDPETVADWIGEGRR
jgi:prevent-host-death family protein